MSAFYIMLHGNHPPKMFHEFKNILKLRKYNRLGDWCLVEDHIIIRVYGFEQDPYKLPIFLTPRIFSLEYIIQRLISDQFHFSQHKQAITFKQPQEVDPFLVNIRIDLVVTKEMLQQLNFEKGRKWVYGPHCVIAARRPMYNHLPNHVVEINDNLDSWEYIK